MEANRPLEALGSCATVGMATDNAEGFKQGAETLQVSVLSDAARHSA